MNQLRKLIILFAAFVSLMGCQPTVLQLYVSPDGKSENPGTVEAPLSTLTEALAAAAKLKSSDPGAPVAIHLAPGEYHLTEPIVISPALSELTIDGANRATIRGSGVFTPAWKPYEGSILVSPIDKNLQFDQLVVNGIPQVLARYPNYDENGGHLQGHAADALAPERVKTWKHPEGAIFNAVHAYEWGDFHYVITGIDAEGQPILSGGHQNNRPAPAHPIYRMVENVFEELDAPGEWFLDPSQQLLYFWPPGTIDPYASVFEAITLKNLLTIQGNEENPVRDVTLTGIRFEYARRTTMEPYEPLLRSDWTIYRGGALLIAGAENCTVRDCEFTNLGGNALFISGYNRNITIAGNHIHECGASGICFVGDTSAVRSPSHQYSEFVPLGKMDTVRGPRSEAYPKDCQADDNLIYRTGRIEKQTAGIQVAMSMNIRISNNSIYDVPRAGINIGDGTWGGHILEYNDVFNTVLESGDHGSFNSWGRDRFWHPDRRTMDSLNLADPQMPLWDAIHTTIIRNNRFRCDHGWDIDLDDGSSNYHIYNNLCLNGGLKLREGFYRVVENNIMVNNSFHPHVWFVNSGDIFRKNIVTDAYKDIRLDGWGKELDYNLFPDLASLEKARSNGTDANSQAGNPMFVNPASGDYSVSEESPAIRLGFKNFPMDQFGVKSPALRALAKTPELPHFEPRQALAASGTGRQEWLGATIKNIETMEERSASGLGKTAGVLLLEIRKNSVAEKAGLQKGDVILRANAKEVATMADLLAICNKTKAGRKVELTLFRNQSERVVEILSHPSITKQKK